MSKVLLFLADGHEEVEAYTVVDIARRAGIELTTVSITGKKEVTGSHSITTIADCLLEEADFNSADMIVLPGGMPGTRNLEACETLMKKVDEFFKEGKYLAAICAAPTIYGHKGYLGGKKATCYPGMEGELTGAKFSRADVAKDGKFITSRGVGTAIPFALAIVEELKDKDTAKKLAASIVYK